jgi:hypothetical protein
MEIIKMLPIYLRYYLIFIGKLNTYWKLYTKIVKLTIKCKYILLYFYLFYRLKYLLS